MSAEDVLAVLIAAYLVEWIVWAFFDRRVDQRERRP